MRFKKKKGNHIRVSTVLFAMLGVIVGVAIYLNKENEKDKIADFDETSSYSIAAGGNLDAASTEDIGKQPSAENIGGHAPSENIGKQQSSKKQALAGQINAQMNRQLYQ